MVGTTVRLKYASGNVSPVRTIAANGCQAPESPMSEARATSPALFVAARAMGSAGAAAADARGGADAPGSGAAGVGFVSAFDSGGFGPSRRSTSS
jgi:hypothetical protein